MQLNAETAKSLEDTNRRLADMKQRATGAGLELTEGLTPALSSMLGVLAGGKSTTQEMIDLGQMLGRTFAFIGMSAYGVASGMDKIFAISEGGRLTAQGREDLANAEELNQKALAMRDIMMGNVKPLPGIPGGAASGGGAGGFEGGNGGKTPKEKSDNGIAAAGAALLEEQAKHKADLQKQFDSAELAELDAQHRMLLVSDADYYQQQLQKQTDGLNAEKAAQETNLATLDALQARQKNDKLLKRDKDGNSAEEYRTQIEILKVKSAISALDAKGRELASANTAEQDASNRKAELAGLELAANLERERNVGLTAQIALLRRRAELDAQKVTAEGGTDADAQNARALGEVAVKQLEIADIGRQINDIEAEHKAKIDAINDAVSRDPRLKKQGGAGRRRRPQAGTGPAEGPGGAVRCIGASTRRRSSREGAGASLRAQQAEQPGQPGGCSVCEDVC